MKEGPPSQGCAAPLVEDMGLLLQNLGGTCLFTGILFLFMIPCGLAICRYDKDKAADEEAVEKKEEDKDHTERKLQNVGDVSKLPTPAQDA